MTTRSAAAKSKTGNDTPEPASLQTIDDKLNSILGILEKNTNDISDIRQEQKDMCASIELCHSEISDVKNIVTNQDLKITKCEEELSRVKEENGKLLKKLCKLENNVREMEQYSHRNNLIIYGIPEQNGENLDHFIRRVANAIQFPDWSSNLVDAMHRMGNATESKPRPIIIKFTSRLQKEEFLKKRKVHRNLKATDLGYSSENSIYVNESLTPANRELLRMAREAAKTKSYSHVWTANCAIFVRRGPGAPAKRIKSAEDLNQL
jgi:hypothetical protein